MNKSFRIIICMIFCSLLFTACGSYMVGQNMFANQLISGSMFHVDKVYDLRGNTVVIPEGVSLVCGQGKFVNGTISGTRTRIIGESLLFENVHITGTWLVPTVTANFFTDLSYDDSLKDLFALTNNAIHNDVIVPEGEYYVTTSSAKAALSLNSRTDLHLDGKIFLRPNNFQQCYVLQIVNAVDVTVSGTGEIIGDKVSHLGTEGEWGMGIYIMNSKNVSISGVGVRDCWGDCIYIGNKSANVSIDKCVIDNGRRQGISITAADNVVVADCLIKNVSGTAPEYAIDIEPNQNCVVSNIRIERVTVKDCVGGIALYGKANGSSIRNVSISDTEVIGEVSKTPFSLTDAEEVTVTRCVSENGKQRTLSARRIKGLNVADNTFSAEGSNTIFTESCTKTVIRNNTARRRPVTR